MVRQKKINAVNESNHLHSGEEMDEKICNHYVKISLKTCIWMSKIININNHMIYNDYHKIRVV